VGRPLHYYSGICPNEMRSKQIPESVNEGYIRIRRVQYYHVIDFMKYRQRFIHATAVDFGP
jgi:hypothetical protein